MRPRPIELVILEALAVSLSAVIGCASPADLGGPIGGEGVVGDRGDDGPVVAADDSVPAATPDGGAASAPATTTEVRATANVNLRKGPSTAESVLAVIPSGTVVKLLEPTPTSSFLHVEYLGTAGWSLSSYFEAVTTAKPGADPVDLDGAPSSANALARAKASVGFSYWWGGGAWLGEGSSVATAGSCSGSCPSCSHSGKYGADCSGMVAKAWQYGASALAVNDHPYSTASFAGASSSWSTISRGALRGADALVYNDGSSGHVALYEQGDGWGAPTVYECRGCAYGCVHDTRTFSSAYKGIRRAGF